MPISFFALMAITSLLMPDSQDSAQAAIRSARERFNIAIAAHDTAALDHDWSDEITVIASRGSVFNGRTAYRAILIDDFKNRPGIVYRRTPKTMTIHLALNIATEEGEWSGTWTDSQGRVDAGGRYIAQWRQVGGRWLLHAEAFGLVRATR